MKKQITFILFLLVSVSTTAQSPQKSTIKEVTLFLNGANVKRTATVPISQGQTQVVFSEISHKIDLSSIKVKGIGDFTIKSVSNKIKVKHPGFDSLKLNMINDTITTLRKHIRKNDQQLKVLAQEEEILKKNRPEFTKDYIIKTIELREVADFHRTRLLDIYQKTTDFQDDNDEKNDKISALSKKLVLLSKQTHAKSEVEVIVEIQSNRAQQTQFEITYFTNHASWSPSYDARVENINDPVDLTLKASISQNTGEDWKDIKITISNGTPTNNEAKPVLQPWFLSQNQPYSGVARNNFKTVSGRVTGSEGESLIGASVSVDGYSNIGTISDIDGRFSLPILPYHKTLVFRYTGYEDALRNINAEIINVAMQEGPLLEEVVVTRLGIRREKAASTYAVSSITGKSEDSKYKNKDITSESSNIEVKTVYRPTTVTYQIVEPYTIISGSAPTQIDIISHEIPSKYQYYAVPKIDESVFLTAEMTDWQDFNLMDGEMNLYFEGAYLGRSYLDLTNANDTLALSLGRDQGVTIQRKRIKLFTKKGFLSSKVTETKAYDIIIRNNKQDQITIEVLDQIPISTSKEVEVTADEISNGKMDEKSKIISWEIPVPSKAQKKIELRYSVKYPQGIRLWIE